jgi:hypothetical protein
MWNVRGDHVQIIAIDSMQPGLETLHVPLPVTDTDLAMGEGSPNLQGSI